MSCRLDLAVRVRHRGEQLAKLISHTEPAFANGDVASGHRDPWTVDDALQGLGIHIENNGAKY